MAKFLKATRQAWKATRLALLVSILATPSFAGSAGDVGTVAINIKQALGSVADLVGTISFLAGVCAVGFGAWKLKHSQQNQPGQLTEAMTSIAVGAILIALPLMAGVGVQTMFGSSGSALTATSGLQQIQ